MPIRLEVYQSLRKHAHAIEIFKVIFSRFFFIFLIFAQNIVCGYRLELTVLTVPTIFSGCIEAIPQEFKDSSMIQVSRRYSGVAFCHAVICPEAEHS